MKHLILAAAIIMPIQASADDNCFSISSLAQSFMEVRQKNIPMRTVVKTISDDDDLSDNLKIYAKKMISAAYSRPLYSTEKHKNRISIEFANEVYLYCVESNSK